MAEESPAGGERTEAPSAKRREDFRKKGQIAQSKEVQTAALLTVLLLFWIFYLPTFWRGFTTLLFSLWQSAGQYQLTASSVISLAFFVSGQLGMLFAPFFLVVVVVAVFSSLFQFGWLFTGKPLLPDFKKLNPISGAARIFSRKSLVEVLKSLLKVSLIGWVAFSTVLSNFEESLILLDTSIASTFSYLARISALILAKICGVLILIAFFDFLFVRWEYEEKMKMTKQEVKEEFKESEGDPHIKAQIRSIQQEMARKRMMAEVVKADVVVTNPTHLSVAILYEAKEMASPKVVAKGADHVAMKIRQLAKEAGVPVIENPPVARLLHKLDLGAHIPEDLFKVVAEILAHVYSLKRS